MSVSWTIPVPVYHKNMPSTPEALQHVISLYGTDNVIGVEGIFTKNDRIDSEKIAAMLRGGMSPVAHVYPKEMRATRDLLRKNAGFRCD